MRERSWAFSCTWRRAPTSPFRPESAAPRHTLAFPTAQVTHEEYAMIIILMGVSGSGKTTIGARLAQALGWPFYDGDQFHPPANVAKMQQGMPLTDEDRWPWLQALRAHIETCIHQGVSAVLACSALKQAYREHLIMDEAEVKLVYLKGDYDLI